MIYEFENQTNEFEWEWEDGSQGKAECINSEEVNNFLANMAGHPVRIWMNGEMIQRGFVASDDSDELVTP